MIVVLVQAVAMVVTAVLAHRKGYNFFLWLLGGGIIGLIVLSFLPFVNKLEEGAERRDKTRRGNAIAGVLAGLGVLVGLGLLLDA